MSIITSIARGHAEGDYDMYFYDYRFYDVQEEPVKKNRGNTEQPERRAFYPDKRTMPPERARQQSFFPNKRIEQPNTRLPRPGRI